MHDAITARIKTENKKRKFIPLIVCAWYEIYTDEHCHISSCITSQIKSERSYLYTDFTEITEKGRFTNEFSVILSESRVVRVSKKKKLRNRQLMMIHTLPDGNCPKLAHHLNEACDRGLEHQLPKLGRGNRSVTANTFF